jgi:hypothetical protein
MAINISTQDLLNYPGIVKTVTVDQSSIVPTGYEGDEQYVQKFSTTAYSDIATTTSIQAIYVTDFKTGWCKSSGFAGSGGKFSLDATHYKLNVKIDASTTTSGSSVGDGYYEISLAYNQDSTPVDGSAVAADMEEKIRAISLHTEDTGFALSYLNASVEYQDGKFYIVSGSVGSYFSGDDRSSVKVMEAATNGCAAELGFNLPLDSETLAGIAIKESYITSNYTTNTTPLAIAAGTGVTAGDCLMITDGVNTDYFTAISGTTSTSVVVATSANNNYVGIANSYTTTSGARVQILRQQDPEGIPTMWYTNIDAIVRWGIKSMVNQIDYSS